MPEWFDGSGCIHLQYRVDSFLPCWMSYHKYRGFIYLRFSLFSTAVKY